jgi:hypothetical protein
MLGEVISRFQSLTPFGSACAMVVAPAGMTGAAHGSGPKDDRKMPTTELHPAECGYIPLNSPVRDADRVKPTSGRRWLSSMFELPH